MTQPSVGSVYNYGGQNYEVTRYEPGSFLVQLGNDDFEDGVEFTDVIEGGGNSNASYVTSADTFENYYNEGECDANDPEAAQLPAGGPKPPKPTQLPADGGPEVNNDLPSPDKPKATPY